MFWSQKLLYRFLRLLITNFPIDVLMHRANDPDLGPGQRLHVAEHPAGALSVGVRARQATGFSIKIQAANRLADDCRDRCARTRGRIQRLADAPVRAGPERPRYAGNARRSP